jgi:type II secretory pathway component PulJ
MKHPNEEELIAYQDGEVLQKRAIAQHLSDCPECRAELERIDAVLAALSVMPVPEPDDDYGQRVWQQIAPRLPERRWRSFDFASGWFEPRRWAAVGALAAIVIVAFLVGRVTKRDAPEFVTADSANVRERVLIMAVGEHLGRSEMVLVELANAEPGAAKQKEVNISSERRRAEYLLEENRLYRQTAREQGDTGLATVLDELERVLLDVAHSPQTVTPAQLETIRQRIAARGILFKVRVISQELQQREAASPAPAAKQIGSIKLERNKT